MVAASARGGDAAATMAARVLGGCAGLDCSPLVAYDVLRSVCERAVCPVACGLVVCPVRVDVGVLTCCVGRSLTEHGLSLSQLV